MKQVTKEEFYAGIFDGRLDVHPKIVSSYPFNTHWVFRDGRMYGVELTTDVVDGVRVYPHVSSYYVA